MLSRNSEIIDSVFSENLYLPTERGSVVVGLSGGVDSSVAAWILKERGFSVTGVFMKNWEEDDHDGYCTSRQDWLDAASVADVLGIELDSVNFSAEYKEYVFSEFLKEYNSGRTPNPDILCNSEIKFKMFLEYASSLGANFIATGHYAQIGFSPGGMGKRLSELSVLRGIDSKKDQSYFLYRLTQKQLSRSCFPIGHLLKSQVRAIAKHIGLPNASKPDSTGICFIGERPFRSFLNRYISTKPGLMIDGEGREVGNHIGLAFYTLGQRKGIGIGGQKNMLGQPWFVARKNVKDNILVVVQGRNHPFLLSRQVALENTHWIQECSVLDLKNKTEQGLTAKIRYRQSDADCRLIQQDQTFFLQFVESQWAVTPGQSAVVYQGPVCLGGGIITSST